MYRPASARTLALCIKADMERESLERYKADALWVLVDWVSHGKAKMRRYGEWLEGIKKPKDNRTAEEIKQEVIERLRGGKHADKPLTNREVVAHVDAMIDMFSGNDSEQKENEKRCQD